MGFKRAFKKLRKALKIPPITLGNVAKVGTAVATGGLPALGTAVVASKLKSAAVSGIKQAVKAKAQKVLAQRVLKQLPGALGAANGKKPAATAMPGGAPIRSTPGIRAGAIIGAAERRSQAAAHRAARPRRKKKTATKNGGAIRRTTSRAKNGVGKRKRAKGGMKDLKALSASWNAAGKPGTWMDWIRAH